MMSPRQRSVLKRNQPSSPASPNDISKKPRRSSRIHGGKVDEEPITPTKPTPVAGGGDTTASPPTEGLGLQRTPASSPGPFEATQVASQFVVPPPPDDTEEDDPTTWGYLVPLNSSTDTSRKTIKLNKLPVCDSQKSQHGTRKKNAKTNAANGFLIGRHPECDLHMESAVISNRHCVLYKEMINGKSRAIIEDLSSNGTWVGGVVVGRNNRRDLNTGDEIEIAGGIQFVFRYPVAMASSKFRDAYELGKPLGSGNFATVYTAIERASGNSYAVKVFKKRRAEGKSRDSGLKQEIGVLMSVSHPNLLCLKGTYEEEDGVYLILELAPEGELFNYIITHRYLDEENARKLFKQLLSGLKYLHDRNIVHRDIKPENILLVDKELTAKIADFGLAKIIGEESFTRTLCGTPSYVAPEILASSKDRRYTKCVDLWSLGVVLYICLCGFPPFSDELCTPENPYNLHDQIRSGRYDFPSPYWDKVTDSACDLIEGMLEVDPKKRLTVDEALAHPWVTNAIFNPADSCGSITNAISNLGFVRRKITQQRTLCADAPDLVSGTVVPRVRNGDQANEVREGASSPGHVDANTKAFLEVGGNGAAETLYGDSYHEVTQDGINDN